MEALRLESPMRADSTGSGDRVEEPSRGRKLTRRKAKSTVASRSLSLDKRVLFDPNGQSGECTTWCIRSSANCTTVCSYILFRYL